MLLTLCSLRNTAVALWTTVGRNATVFFGDGTLLLEEPTLRA
jgi:hypothetical protein